MRMSTPSQTVFVIDDDIGVCDSLRCLLEAYGFTVETFLSAQDFLASDAWSDGGCAIVDACMPGMSGLELQDILAERNGALCVIVVTGNGDVPMAVRALKAGACDFLEKPFDERILVPSVRAALERASLRSAQVRAVREAQKKLGKLTEREREILELVAEGQANKRIARILNISPRTVEIHRANIMQKTGASNATDLVHIVIGAS